MRKAEFPTSIRDLENNMGFEKERGQFKSLTRHLTEDESYYNLERKAINHLEHLTWVNSYDLKLPGSLVCNNLLGFLHKKINQAIWDTINDFWWKERENKHMNTHKRNRKHSGLQISESSTTNSMSFFNSNFIWSSEKCTQSLFFLLSEVDFYIR